MARIERRIDATNTVIISLGGDTEQGNYNGQLTFTFTEPTAGIDDATLEQMTNDMLFAVEFHERKREEDIQYMLNQVNESAEEVNYLAEQLKVSTKEIKDLSDILENNTSDVQGLAGELNKQVQNVEDLNSVLSESIQQVETLQQKVHQQKAHLDTLDSKSTTRGKEVDILQSFINTVVGNAIVTNDSNLWAGQYKELVSFVQPIEEGKTYHTGDIVKVRDPEADPDTGAGAYVLIRIDTQATGDDTVTYDGLNFFNESGFEEGSQQYYNYYYARGYDLRPYDRYYRKPLDKNEDGKND